MSCYIEALRQKLKLLITKYILPFGTSLWYCCIKKSLKTSLWAGLSIQIRHFFLDIGIEKILLFETLLYYFTFE